MKILLLTLISILVITFIVTHAILAKDYKYYKSVYKMLPYFKFYKAPNNVVIATYKENLYGFLWFIDENKIKLYGSHYLFDFYATYYSLHAWYWLIKYRKWVQKNVDLENLQLYNN